MNAAAPEDEKRSRLEVLKQRAARGDRKDVKPASTTENHYDDDTKDHPEACFGGYKRELEMMMNTVRYNDHLLRMNLRRPLGMLLYGPSGTGKTTLVKHFIEVLRGTSACHDPVIVNGPELLSKYVGDSESRLRKMFEKARSEQRHPGGKLHVFVFEEIDSLFSKRGNACDEGGADASKKTTDNLVNQVLTLIDGMTECSNILVIGTTNRHDMLDPALLRPGRMDTRILVDLPDEQDRLDIFRYYVSRVTSGSAVSVSSDVDLVFLARNSEGCTGADIEAHIRDAAIQAIQRDSVHIVLTMQDFVQTAAAHKKRGRQQQDRPASPPPPVVETQDGMLSIISALLSNDEKEGKALLIFPRGDDTGTVKRIEDVISQHEHHLVKVGAADALGKNSDELRDIVFTKWGECQQDREDRVRSVLFIDLVEHVIQYTDLELAFDNTLLHTVLSLITCCKRFGVSVIVTTRIETDVAKALKLTDKFDRTALLA